MFGTDKTKFKFRCSSYCGYFYLPAKEGRFESPLRFGRARAENMHAAKRVGLLQKCEFKGYQKWLPKTLRITTGVSFLLANGVALNFGFAFGTITVHTAGAIRADRTRFDAIDTDRDETLAGVEAGIEPVSTSTSSIILLFILFFPVHALSKTRIHYVWYY